MPSGDGEAGQRDWLMDGGLKSDGLRRSAKAFSLENIHEKGGTFQRGGEERVDGTFKTSF